MQLPLYLFIFYALIFKVLLGMLLPPTDVQADVMPQESLMGNRWLILISVL